MKPINYKNYNSYQSIAAPNFNPNLINQNNNKVIDINNGLSKSIDQIKLHKTPYSFSKPKTKYFALDTKNSIIDNILDQNNRLIVDILNTYSASTSIKDDLICIGNIFSINDKYGFIKKIESGHFNLNDSLSKGNNQRNYKIYPTKKHLNSESFYFRRLDINGYIKDLVINDVVIFRVKMRESASKVDNPYEVYVDKNKRAIDVMLLGDMYNSGFGVPRLVGKIVGGPGCPKKDEILGTRDGSNIGEHKMDDDQWLLEYEWLGERRTTFFSMQDIYPTFRHNFRAAQQEDPVYVSFDIVAYPCLESIRHAYNIKIFGSDNGSSDQDNWNVFYTGTIIGSEPKRDIVKIRVTSIGGNTVSAGTELSFPFEDMACVIPSYLDDHANMFGDHNPNRPRNLELRCAMKPGQDIAFTVERHTQDDRMLLKNLLFINCKESLQARYAGTLVKPADMYGDHNLTGLIDLNSTSIPFIVQYAIINVDAIDTTNPYDRSRNFHDYNIHGSQNHASGDHNEICDKGADDNNIVEETFHGDTVTFSLKSESGDANENGDLHLMARDMILSLDTLAKSSNETRYNGYFVKTYESQLKLMVIMPFPRSSDATAEIPYRYKYMLLPYNPDACNFQPEAIDANFVKLYQVTVSETLSHRLPDYPDYNGSILCPLAVRICESSDTDNGAEPRANSLADIKDAVIGRGGIDRDDESSTNANFEDKIYLGFVDYNYYPKSPQQDNSGASNDSKDPKNNASSPRCRYDKLFECYEKLTSNNYHMVKGIRYLEMTQFLSDAFEYDDDCSFKSKISAAFSEPSFREILTLALREYEHFFTGNNFNKSSNHFNTHALSDMFNQSSLLLTLWDFVYDNALDYSCHSHERRDARDDNLSEIAGNGVSKCRDEILGFLPFDTYNINVKACGTLVVFKMRERPRVDHVLDVKLLPYDLFQTNTTYRGYLVHSKRKPKFSDNSNGSFSHKNQVKCDYLVLHDHSHIMPIRSFTSQIRNKSFPQGQHFYCMIDTTMPPHFLYYTFPFNNTPIAHGVFMHKRFDKADDWDAPLTPPNTNLRYYGIVTRLNGDQNAFKVSYGGTLKILIVVHGDFKICFDGNQEIAFYFADFVPNDDSNKNNGYTVAKLHDILEFALPIDSEYQFFDEDVSAGSGKTKEGVAVRLRAIDLKLLEPLEYVLEDFDKENRMMHLSNVLDNRLTPRQLSMANIIISRFDLKGYQALKAEDLAKGDIVQCWSVDIQNKTVVLNAAKKPSYFDSQIPWNKNDDKPWKRGGSKDYDTPSHFIINHKPAHENGDVKTVEKTEYDGDACLIRLPIQPSTDENDKGFKLHRNVE
ncbi:unnamed protein product [Gordionus sp. m RMFG-2023]